MLESAITLKPSHVHRYALTWTGIHTDLQIASFLNIDDVRGKRGCGVGHEKPCYDGVTVVLDSPNKPTRPLLVGTRTLEA